MKKLYLYSQYMDATQNSTGFYFSRLFNGLSIRFPGLLKIQNKTSDPKDSALKYFAPNSAKNSLVFRIFEQFFISIELFIRIVQTIRRGDVFLTGTNPTLLLIWLPIVKRIIKFRWILVVHDVFPNNLVPAKILRADSTIYRILDLIFSWAYSSADRLIVIGQDMNDLMSIKTGGIVPTVYIPNWACDKDVFPIKKTDANYICDLGWEDKIVFQFFGNIGRLQGLEMIIEAISLTKNPDHAFLFIGGGAMVGSVKNLIDNFPKVNVAYVGPLELDKKNYGLNACDVAIVSLDVGMLGLGAPSKSYFSMAADKPILAVMEANTEIARMVKDHDIGWHVEPKEPLELALMFDKINTVDIDRIRGRPRHILKSFYSEQDAINLYSACIDEVMT